MSTPAYKRSDRVSKLLHEETSKIVHGLKDPRLGFVTVVGFKLTDDMTEARVFCSIIGSESEKKQTIDVLNRASGFIRHRLMEIVELRTIPSMQFVYDDTGEKAEKVFTILNKLENERTQEETKTVSPGIPENVKPKRKKRSNQ